MSDRTDDQDRRKKLNKIKLEYYKHLIESRADAIKQINAAKAKESAIKGEYRDLMCRLAEAKQVVSEKQAKYNEVLSALTEYKKLTLEDFEADLQVEDVLPGDENTPS